jgi:hypothetical protein
MGKDLNAQNFRIVQAEVVDKRKRDEIKQYSNQAHFNFSAT